MVIVQSVLPVMMVVLKTGIDCVFKELWKLSSFLLYCGGLLLADKKRVLLSKIRRSFYPVKITGIQVVFFCGY